MTSEDKDQIARGYELEYTALRGEILKRIEMRQQIMALALTIAGVILGWGITAAGIALVYPPLAMFLAIAWTQNDTRIYEMAVYTREHFEKAIPGLGWESYIQAMRQADAQRGRWRTTVLSHGGTFLFTQLIAMGIGLAKFAFSPGEYLLLALDAVCVLLMLRVLAHGRR